MTKLLTQINALYAASHEVGVDIVYSQNNQTNVVDKSFVGFDKLDSQLALVDHTNTLRPHSTLGTFEDFPIGPNFLVTRDNSFHIDNLDSSTLLSLVHLDLINWSIHSQMTMRFLATKVHATL